MKSNNEKHLTKIVMHRGYSALARENTMHSFLLAAKQKDIYGIETDVWLTKDNKLILIHDDNTNRVSLGKHCLSIKESTFDELRTIRLPDINGNEDVEQIPSFSEYLILLKNSNKIGFLELKENFTNEQLEIILNDINRVGLPLNKLVFISFHKEALIKLSNKNLSLKMMLLLHDVSSLSIKDYEELKKHHIGFDIEYSHLTDDEILSIQKRGIEINIWTVDNKEIAHKFNRMGIDYITTNCITSWKD